jgi:hypothetical protein
MKTVSRRCGFFSAALVCVAALGLVISGCPLDGLDSQVTVSSVTVSPANPAVRAGETLAFSALVAGTNNPPQTVTWSVEGGVEGTAISTDGVLSVAAAETASSLTVRAVSTFDTTKSGRANVTVSAAEPEPDPEPEPESEALAGTLSIEGTAQVGALLTVNESGLTNKSGTASYQWKRGAENTGADQNSYQVAAEDLGATITVVVSYSGTTGSVTSAPTAAVVAATEPEKPTLTGVVSIEGTAKVGLVLSAGISGLTNLAGTPVYQWKRDGANIGTNAATYMVDITDFDAHIAVLVSSSGNAGSVASAATAAVEKQTLDGTVSINGTAKVGESLTINEDGLTNKIGSPSYQWQRDGDTIADATAASYTLVQDDAGHAITVVVSYSGNTGSVASAATAAVEKQTLNGTVSINGTAKVGESLTINESGLTNKSGTPSYQWQRGGDTIADAAAASYTLVQDDAEHAITVVVSYSGNTGSVTSAATDAVLPCELGGTVSITGDARVGGQLTVDESELRYQAGTPTYQWKKNGTNTGMNENSYQVVAADLGATITVVVSYSGNAGSITSAATAAVAKPLLTGGISIMGAAQKGQTLTADISGGNGTGTAAYQWKRGENDIPGADSATYSLAAEDVGYAIKVRASYADKDGSITSAPTAAVDINRTFTLTAFGRQITLTDGRAGATDDLDELGVKGKLQTALDEMAGDADLYNVLDRGVTFVVVEDDSLSDYYVVVDNRTMHIEYYYALNPDADWIHDMLKNGMYDWTAKANSVPNAIRLANDTKRTAPVIDGSAGAPDAFSRDKFLSKSSGLLPGREHLTGNT